MQLRFQQSRLTMKFCLLSKIRNESATTCILNHKWDTNKMNWFLTLQSRMTSSAEYKRQISFSRFFLHPSLPQSSSFYCVRIYEADQVALVCSTEFQIGNLYDIHPQNNSPVCMFKTKGCNNLTPASCSLKSLLSGGFKGSHQGRAEILLPFLQKGEVKICPILLMRQFPFWK